MYKEQGGEIPLSALFVTSASGSQKGADRASFNTLKKKKERKKKEIARAVKVRNVR